MGRDHTVLIHSFLDSSLARKTNMKFDRFLVDIDPGYIEILKLLQFCVENDQDLFSSMKSFQSQAENYLVGKNCIR